jgi:calpain-7
MQELNLVEDEAQRGFLARHCRKLLDKAEEIKGASIYQPSAHIVRAGTRNTARIFGLGLRPTNPETRRPFTTREKIILLEGSRLNGFVFPPWTSPPSPSEFETEAGESLYQ